MSPDEGPSGRSDQISQLTVAGWLLEAETRHSWAIEANDGIIATAGLLLGFAGAGASDRLLLFTAIAATIAGSLTVGGATWAEHAAAREYQLTVAERERHELTTDPVGELEELVRHWQDRGLTAEVAHEVAAQLAHHDALGAQLEWEYGFTEPMPRAVPVLSGVTAAVAYALGALIPLLITYFAPVAIETWAVLLAVAIALGLTSFVAARATRLSTGRMLLRSLTVGGCTLLASYVAGDILLS